jgi:tetratricopeptide (TPR) repeat protein
MNVDGGINVNQLSRVIAYITSDPDNMVPTEVQRSTSRVILTRVAEIEPCIKALTATGIPSYIIIGGSAWGGLLPCKRADCGSANRLNSAGLRAVLLCLFDFVSVLVWFSTTPFCLKPRQPSVKFMARTIGRLGNGPSSAYWADSQAAIDFVGALNGLAWCKLYTDSVEEVIPLMEQAIRLSPRDPLIGYRYFLIGTVDLLQSRTDEAIIWLEKARTDMPDVPGHHSRLASAYALRGETERAVAELAEARRLAGEGSFASIARLKSRGWWGVPKVLSLFEATYFAGLRKAGMREE